MVINLIFFFFFYHEHFFYRVYFSSTYIDCLYRREDDILLGLIKNLLSVYQNKVCMLTFDCMSGSIKSVFRKCITTHTAVYSCAKLG